MKIFFYCKECYSITGKRYDSIAQLLFNHSVLKEQTQLIGVIIEIDGKEYIEINGEWV